MKQLNTISFVCISLLVLPAAGCSKEDTKDCTPAAIMYTATASDSCLHKGTLTVQSPAGTGYMYAIGNNLFQPSPLIQNLLPGEYNLKVQSPGGCMDSTTVTIPKTATGVLFRDVKAVLSTYCFPCHTGSNPQAGNDWARSCDILHQWERIKARAVDGNPAPMPPGGLIPQSERDKIVNWINAGHRLSD